MRKADLVNVITEKTGVAKVDVLVTLEALFSEVKETMKNGENVYIRGFGSFVIKRRAPKKGLNIKAQKTIAIPEHYVPAFKPAKIFTDEVKANVNKLPDDNGADD